MNKSIKIWITAFTAFSIAALVIFSLIRLNIFSGWFEVRRITVLDNTYLPDSLLIKLSGIEKGNGIFNLDLKKGTREIMKNPYIKGVVISRELPYDIIIRIKERKPMAAFRRSKKWLLISEDNMVLPLVDEVALGKVPVVSGIKWNEKIKPGYIIKEKNEKRFLNVVREVYLNHPVIYALAAEINFSNKSDAVIKLMRGNGKIIFSKNNYVGELKKLKLFFGQMNRLSVLENNEYINLKYSDRIIVMNHQ